MDNYFSARDILEKAIGTDAYFQIKSILTSTKAADVVEVVRCRDCRRFLLYTAEYKEKAENADGDCGMLILGCADNQYAARLADDFCSYGQRKEAEQSDAHAPH